MMTVTDFLNGEPGIRVVGSAVSLASGLTAALLARPAVVIIDPGDEHVLDIALAVEEFRAALPNAGLIVMTVHDDEHNRRAALNAGADAFISQWESGDHLVGAIRDYANRPTGRAMPGT